MDRLRWRDFGGMGHAQRPNAGELAAHTAHTLLLAQPCQPRPIRMSRLRRLCLGEPLTCMPTHSGKDRAAC